MVLWVRKCCNTFGVIMARIDKERPAIMALTFTRYQYNCMLRVTRADGGDYCYVNPLMHTDSKDVHIQILGDTTFEITQKRGVKRYVHVETPYVGQMCYAQRKFWRRDGEKFDHRVFFHRPARGRSRSYGPQNMPSWAAQKFFYVMEKRIMRKKDMVMDDYRMMGLTHQHSFYKQFYNSAECRENDVFYELIRLRLCKRSLKDLRRCLR